MRRSTQERRDKAKLLGICVECGAPPRMNGGLGNRSAFSLAPLGQTPGPHVRRDITALLEFREEMLDRNPAYPSNSGVPLLWTLPWDGSPAEALLPNRLDVFYIEVCRRVRLLSDSDGQLYGRRTSSKAARIESKDLKGRMGDPWTPSNSKRDGLPLTLSAGGFNYKRVTDYLTSTDWSRSQLLLPTKPESTEGGRRVSVLKRQEGAPVLLG